MNDNLNCNNKTSLQFMQSKQFSILNIVPLGKAK